MKSHSPPFFSWQKSERLSHQGRQQLMTWTALEGFWSSSGFWTVTLSTLGDFFSNTLSKCICCNPWVIVGIAEFFLELFWICIRYSFLMLHLNKGKNTKHWNLLLYCIIQMEYEGQKAHVWLVVCRNFSSEDSILGTHIRKMEQRENSYFLPWVCVSLCFVAAGSPWQLILFWMTVSWYCPGSSIHIGSHKILIKAN